MFSKPEIRKLFAPYELVQLYTDIVPNDFYSPEARARFGSGTDRQEQDAKVNYDFQRKIFDDVKLPLYAILEPRLDNTIRVVGVYDEGRIMNEGAFVQFLRTPVMNASSGAVAQASGR